MVQQQQQRGLEDCRHIVPIPPHLTAHVLVAGGAAAVAGVARSASLSDGGGAAAERDGEHLPGRLPPTGGRGLAHGQEGRERAQGRHQAASSSRLTERQHLFEQLLPPISQSVNACCPACLSHLLRSCAPSRACCTRRTGPCRRWTGTPRRRAWWPWHPPDTSASTRRWTWTAWWVSCHRHQAS